MIIVGAVAASAFAAVGFVTFNASANTAYTHRKTASSMAPTATTPPPRSTVADPASMMDAPLPPPPAPQAPAPSVPMPSAGRMSAPPPPFANDGDLDNIGGANDNDGSK
jgi:hypothetical protein